MSIWSMEGRRIVSQFPSGKGLLKLFTLRAKFVCKSLLLTLVNERVVGLDWEHYHQQSR